MALSLPRVGLTTYREPARWGEWDERADLLPADYTDAVHSAGAAAVLLPPAPDGHAAAVLDGQHALVIAGGPDVDPARYGSRPHPRTGAARTDRDAWELALVREALGRDLPLLAICRGMQVLNVALGGSLVQHLPDVVGTEIHSPVRGAHGRHDVTLAEGSRLAGVCGAAIRVATHHHQAVERLGDGLVACGWAPDGTVEAVDLPARTWAYGVQWHPEAYSGAALFTALADAARAYARAEVRT